MGSQVTRFSIAQVSLISFEESAVESKVVVTVARIISADGRLNVSRPVSALPADVREEMEQLRTSVAYYVVEYRDRAEGPSQTAQTDSPADLERMQNTIVFHDRVIERLWEQESQLRELGRRLESMRQGR